MKTTILTVSRCEYIVSDVRSFSRSIDYFNYCLNYHCTSPDLSSCEVRWTRYEEALLNPLAAMQ